MFKSFTVFVLMVVLAGCSPNMDVKKVDFGESTGVYSGGNLRLVTERPRGYGYPKVVCTEPSPDYAVAFDRTRQLTITPPPTASASKVEVNASTVEAVTAGGGREAAVLALRDGLYTACQSYANGVIGQDAYAIILSQYGNLLVALVGSESAAKTIQVSGPQAALSAMTVACISSHDATRAKYDSNSMLTPKFCGEVLGTVLAASKAAGGKGGLAVGAKPPVDHTQDGVQKPDVKKGNARAETSVSTANITTKTTTETTVKP